MLRGNLAADLVLNRRSRSAATRRFSFEPIRLASLPLADLGCESGSCLVRGESILPFSPRAWPQGQCAWASRQSAPPEPMLADVACGSDFCFAAAIRARPSIVARVALLRVYQVLLPLITGVFLLPSCPQCRKKAPCLRGPVPQLKLLSARITTKASKMS